MFKNYVQIKKLEAVIIEKETKIDELNSEIHQKLSLINSFYIESNNKNILLKQLDSTIGYLTNTWKTQKKQDNAKLRVLKNKDTQTSSKLEDLKNQFKQSQNT